MNDKEIAERLEEWIGAFGHPVSAQEVRAIIWSLGQDPELRKAWAARVFQEVQEARRVMEEQ
jgi:hypothetical protein